MTIPWNAVAAIGGSIMSGLFGQSSASRSIDFQREAMQNSIQWKVADMKKAGLNPILASGMNTSVPSGATAQMPDLGASLSRAVSTANEQKAIEKQLEVADAQRKLIEEQAEEVRQKNEAQYWGFSAGNLRANTQKLIAETKRATLDMDRVAQETQRLIAQTKQISAQTSLIPLQKELLKKQSQLASIEKQIKLNEKKIQDVRDVPKARLMGEIYNNGGEVLTSDAYTKLKKDLADAISAIKEYLSASPAEAPEINEFVK